MSNQNRRSQAASLVALRPYLIPTMYLSEQGRAQIQSVGADNQIGGLGAPLQALHFSAVGAVDAVQQQRCITAHFAVRMSIHVYVSIHTSGTTTVLLYATVSCRWAGDTEAFSRQLDAADPHSVQRFSQFVCCPLALTSRQRLLWRRRSMSGLSLQDLV